MQQLVKPSKDKIWEMAVNKWLQHVTNSHVERLLLAALDVTQNIDEAIIWLMSNGYISTIGNYGSGIPGGLKIDVGGSARADDFIKVYWGTWEDISHEFDITLEEVLKWLQAGKQRDVQLDLFKPKTDWGNLE